MAGGESVWQRWQAAPSDWTVDWHRSVGALAADVDSTNAARSWCEFLIHLNENGYRGRWTAKFRQPVTLAVGDGVRADVATVRAHPSGRIELACSTERRRGCIVARERIHRPSMRWRGSTVRFLTQPDIAALNGDRIGACTGDEELDDQWIWNFAAAAQLLDDCAPSYGRWVRRVVRHVVVMTPMARCTMSSSDALASGVVRMSLSHDPVTIAELMVHEATHGYFHLLENAGPIEDGSDPTLYYSPFKRQIRPIRAILLAFHAFANIVFFYRLLLESGARIDRRAVQEASGEVERQLDTLREPLLQTPALTERGIAVRDELFEQLGSRRTVA